jgi:predicted DNA-binding transcriptional regulator YafY
MTSCVIVLLTPLITTMRADRLLSALLVLQAHGKQTGRELAARLEVSERTVHRDMEALGAAGLPVLRCAASMAVGNSTPSGGHGFPRLTMLSCAGC